jgi:hypothetical protein
LIPIASQGGPRQSITSMNTLEGEIPGHTCEKFLSPLALVIYFALLKLLIHLIFINGYGYFRDELYYLACGDHLDWGYVDHAPLIALISRAVRLFWGDSLFSIRLLPAVAGALKVLLTGLIVRELGGKRFAVVLACLCILLSGHLVIDSFLSMNSFEGVFWTGCVLCFLLAIKRSHPRYWILFGILAGIGLMNKHSTLFFGAGMFAGIVLTKNRSQLAEKWVWIGGGLALLIFLPNLVWEWRHDWATVELLRNVQITGKNVVFTPLAFLLEQCLEMGPLGAPVWIAGILYYLLDGEGKRFRALGIAYLVLLILMILLHGKPYYMFSIYPMLFAGGSVSIEKLLRFVRHPGFVRVAYSSILGLSMLIPIPYVLPVLPLETFLRYQNLLGFEVPKIEVGFDSPLPQHFADRLGWPEMVKAVAAAYQTLSAEEKSRAAIFASNYGQAAAVDFWGAEYGLPKSICPHQSYFLWGPRQYKGEVVIILGAKREGWERMFESVEEAGRVWHPYTMSYERYSIYIGRDLKVPLSQLWPRLRFWN